MAETAGEESSQALKPERRIGSYRIVAALGSGGMSSVFRAVHEETGNEVAVKVLPRSLAKNPTLLQRFLREAKSAEALEHPNIVSIYDRGVDQGRHYLVLELVDGGDLHDRVRNHGPLELSEAIAVVRAVAEGLKYAASLGLIHRDIKPANLLLSPTGQVKIIDLGLALQAESEDERVTRDGTTVGTVDYMAPEQARDSRGTSERSDMYSLGCTFYYLLTGSPPYPGGDLADKLSRHCLGPIPDPRAIRPEIPESLAQLVRKMMAKKPENRFADYDKLIAALDALSDAPASPPLATLDALIADDDDEEEEPRPVRPPGVLNALIADDDDDEENGQPAKPPAALDALIADDDDEDETPSAPSPSRGPKGRGAPPRRKIEPEYLIPMADLAALDDEPSPRAPRPVRAESRAPIAPEPSFDALSGEDAEPAAALKGRIRASATSDAETRKWVIRLSAIGVGVILFIVGVDQIIKAARDTPATTSSETEVEEPGAPLVAVNTVATPSVPPVFKAAEKPKSPVVAPVVPNAWAEPSDHSPASLVEPTFSAGVESKFLPEWASAPIPEKIDGPFVVVRRIADPSSSTEKTSVRLAFDAIGGTIEIADNGPFFEDEFRVTGESRLIKAGPRFRPILAIEAPKLELLKEQPALIVLDGKQTILDGLDLIVNVDDLAREQTALFLCRGGALTLRNCTITILNPKGMPFSAIKTGPAAKGARIRLERSLIRGPGITALDLSSGPADVVVDRSVLIGGPNALVTAGGTEPTAERRIHLVRSILASRAALFECGEPGPGARPRPISIRALGSTFASLHGGAPASLIVLRDRAIVPADGVQWLGESNVFVGWKSWVASGTEVGVKVAHLAAARSVWPGTDARSQESATAWPVTTPSERIVPEELQTLAPSERAMLARVAAPSPYLAEKSLLSFKKPAVPEWVPSPLAANPTPPQPKTATPPITMSPPTLSSSPAPKGGRAPLRPAVKPAPVARPLPPPAAPPPSPPTPPPPPTGDLNFDADAPPWDGDLGRFLQSHPAGGAKHLRIAVRGTGPHSWTPIRLPDGVTLEVIVEPTPAGAAPLSWSPLPLSEADALIETHDGNLILSGVVLTRDATSKPKALVRVDGGHLVLNRCRFLAPGVVDPGGGGLIDFEAPTTRPLTPAHDARPGPFSGAFDRPVCRLVDCVLITGGDVLKADVGHGLVALTQCAIAAGNTAFTLSPAKVARSRFNADLYLDHCTVAAEHNFFVLGAWPGSDPGPDRPWLVWSQDNAYVAHFAAGPRDQVLLRVEKDALAHSALCWQGINDAYEVPHFTARDQAIPPPNARPDVHRQWAALWGANHFRVVTGPGKIGAQPSVRFVERLRPGQVSPADLVLDPDQHRDRSALNLGASPARLGLKTGNRSGRK